MNKTLLAASLLALASLSSVAAAADDNWFVRGEVGRSSTNVAGDSFHGTAFSGRVGYYFNPNFAIEGSYTNFGSDNVFGLVDVKAHAWGVGLVGKKDFGPNDTGFFIDGRVGVARVTTTANAFGFGGSSAKTKGYVGVGAGYDFTRNFGLSLNYDYTGADTGNGGGHISTVTAGLEGRF